ncbi:hypothetical protein GCM10023219_24210 [Stakelama sediminis]|uniref:Lipoprotein n=1 Tax=Stakelama sediminis TaxID=463200 RepID=A0A840YYN8_9SPHN|nr:hypothetical protein [Stakelama sediminis]MBB5718901.1 hypothetical protein [Stakelama sediminis]
MRISDLGLITILSLALAGCGQGISNGNNGTSQPPRDKGEHIACSPAGSDGFIPDCTVDSTTTDQGTVLTVRQPDGSFHRLLVTQDGNSVTAADGAEPAKATVLSNGQIEVVIGGARYRLPTPLSKLAS